MSCNHLVVQVLNPGPAPVVVQVLNPGPAPVVVQVLNPGPAPVVVQVLNPGPAPVVVNKDVRVGVIKGVIKPVTDSSLSVHTIDTGDNQLIRQPIRQHPRRLPFHQHKEVSELVNSMLSRESLGIACGSCKEKRWEDKVLCGLS